MSVNSVRSDNWAEMKRRLKTRMDKFNDKEVEGFRDSLDSLSVKIQTICRYAKKRAENEYKEYKTSKASQTDLTTEKKSSPDAK